MKKAAIIILIAIFSVIITSVGSASSLPINKIVKKTVKIDFSEPQTTRPARKIFKIIEEEPILVTVNVNKTDDSSTIVIE